MALQLFSTIPLMNLATRTREIKEFSKEIFPKIETALDDMGLSGTVEFTSSRKELGGYDTAVIKAKKPGDTASTVVTVQFPSATPTGDYIVRWKDAGGVANIETTTTKRPDLVDIIESYFATAYGQSEAKGCSEGIKMARIRMIKNEERVGKRVRREIEKAVGAYRKDRDDDKALQALKDAVKGTEFEEKALCHIDDPVIMAPFKGHMDTFLLDALAGGAIV